MLLLRFCNIWTFGTLKAVNSLDGHQTINNILNGNWTKIFRLWHVPFSLCLQDLIYLEFSTWNHWELSIDILAEATKLPVLSIWIMANGHWFNMFSNWFQEIWSNVFHRYLPQFHKITIQIRFTATFISFHLHEIWMFHFF